jgi:hypothetical protein
MTAHHNNRHNDHDRRGLVLTLVFAGALLIGFQSAARWAMEVRQQLEMTIPEWIPRVILENALMALHRILS